MSSNTMIDADDIFGELKTKNTPARKGKVRGRKVGADLLAELKVKMVMRIYGASRARAMEIIAGRAGERQALEHAQEEARAAKRPHRFRGDESMAIEEFFGA